MIESNKPTVLSNLLLYCSTWNGTQFFLIKILHKPFSHWISIPIEKYGLKTLFMLEVTKSSNNELSVPLWEMWHGNQIVNDGQNQANSHQTVF